jgi:hypothetical protein
MSQSLKQAELFESEALAPVHSVGTADPARVRVKLHAMLDELREGTSRLDYINTVFPQMVRWLPEAEAAELMRAFRASAA